MCIYLYDTWYINVSYIFFQNLVDVILRCHDPLIKSLDLWAHEPCTYQENLAPKAGPATWHRNSIVKGRLKCPFILVRDSSDSSFICCLCEMTPEMNKQWASLWSFAQLIFLCFYLACHLVANQCKAKLNNDGAEIGFEISLFRCGVLLDWQLSGPRQRQKYQMKSACWTSHSNMQSLIFTFNFSGRQTPASIENALAYLQGLEHSFHTLFWFI